MLTTTIEAPRKDGASGCLYIYIFTMFLTHHVLGCDTFFFLRCYCFNQLNRLCEFPSIQGLLMQFVSFGQKLFPPIPTIGGLLTVVYVAGLQALWVTSCFKLCMSESCQSHEHNSNLQVVTAISKSWHAHWHANLYLWLILLLNVDFTILKTFGTLIGVCVWIVDSKERSSLVTDMAARTNGTQFFLGVKLIKIKLGMQRPFFPQCSTMLALQSACMVMVILDAGCLWNKVANRKCSWMSSQKILSEMHRGWWRLRAGFLFAWFVCWCQIWKSAMPVGLLCLCVALIWLLAAWCCLLLLCACMCTKIIYRTFSKTNYHGRLYDPELLLRFGICQKG